MDRPLILPASGSGVPLATAGDAAAVLSRREQRVQQREAERLARRDTVAVTYGVLPELVARLVGPRLGAVMQSMQEGVVTQLAVVELLEAKGILTRAEVEAKEQELVQQLRDAVAAAEDQVAAQSAPPGTALLTREEAAGRQRQSPAYQEARRHAPGQPVARLTEGPESARELREAYPTGARLIEG